MVYTETKDFNLNAPGYTNVLALGDCSTASAQVSHQTGSTSAFVLLIEGSIDMVKWVTTGTSVNAEGVSPDIDVSRFRAIRGSVTTVNGAALVSTVSLLAKSV